MWFPAKPTGADRAVSPVVGVVLIIALTLMLAAVATSGFMSFGEDAAETAPQATLTVDPDVANNRITIVHDGGDGLNSETTRVSITIDGSASTWSETESGVLAVGDTATFNFTGTPDTGPSTGPWSGYGADDGGSDDELSAGDDVVVEVIDTASQQVVFRAQLTA